MLRGSTLIARSILQAAQVLLTEFVPSGDTHLSRWQLESRGRSLSAGHSQHLCPSLGVLANGLIFVLAFAVILFMSRIIGRPAHAVKASQEKFQAFLGSLGIPAGKKCRSTIRAAEKAAISSAESASRLSCTSGDVRRNRCFGQKPSSS